MSIQRIEMENSEYVTCNSEIANVNGMDVINMDITVQKPVDKVMFEFVMLAKNGDEFVPVHKCDPMDPCLPGKMIDPMMMEQMGMLGNMTDLCPLKPGYYAIKNLSFDKKFDGDMKVPPGTYRIDMIGTTEAAGVRVPFMVKKVHFLNE